MRRNQRQGLSRVQAGAILVVLAVIATYFGFTKAVPFRHHWEIKAQFDNAANLRKGSFVRIGGVNVGKVVGIQFLRRGDRGAVATLRIDEMGRPIHKDATLKIRPNIFLEGNTFIDLKPGSPSAPKVGDGDTIRVNQTSNAVQIDQLFTALQSDTRRNLQLLLKELGAGLEGRGAQGWNKSIDYWQGAFRGSAVVGDAQLGLQQHDLSRYISRAGTVAGALDRDPEALKSLITDFNTTAAAFAVEQNNLEQTIAELPRTLRAAQPALASLNAAFPPLRRLVVDLRPAVRSSGPALRASRPFIHQAALLVRQSELKGLVGDLKPLVPDLARLNVNLVPLYEQVRSASSCQNEVVLPWSHQTVPDPNFPATGQVFQESVSGFPGLAAESRSGDANGQWARVLAGNGTNVYALGGADPQFGQRFGISNFPITGVNPPKAERPPSRYDVPCETQQAPDLRTIPGQALTPQSTGHFTPLQAALNQANQFEGVADALKREGHPDKANGFYARARALRVQNGLLGHQWDLKGGRLTIVDTKSTDLTAGGAPRLAPYALRGGKNRMVSFMAERSKLTSAKGAVNAR
ncbi:MAG: phospholipid/cholesterol/gamma-HCH transport system substrate-binding protein [Solirubrobacteraceae bacterium]|jgi:virulence factor Mce-like protein|nr:phospholipid/cholesterol/gamma-HCH transport system substrate-binding protein [Solirubrobacteraceae bacterium]